MDPDKDRDPLILPCPEQLGVLNISSLFAKQIQGLEQVCDLPCPENIGGAHYAAVFDCTSTKLKPRSQTPLPTLHFNLTNPPTNKNKSKHKSEHLS